MAEVIDAQVHPPGIRDLVAWAGGADAPARARLAVEMTRVAMEAAGVDAAMMHWGPDILRTAYRAYPHRFRGVLAFSPSAHGDELGHSVTLGEPSAVADQVGALRDQAGVVGVRILIGIGYERIDGTAGDRVEHYVPLVSGLEHYAAVIAAARTHGLPVSVYGAGRLGDVERLVEANPDVEFVLDHLGLVPLLFGVGDPFVDLPQLLALARFENLDVKLSAAPRVSRQAYPFDDIREHLRDIVSAFGAERVMWGSDFTVTPNGSYAESVDFISLDPPIR